MDRPDSVKMPIITPVKYPDGKGALADCYELEINCHSRKQYKKTIYFSTVLTKISTLIALPGSIMSRLMDTAGSEPSSAGGEINLEKAEGSETMTPQQLSMAIKLNAGEYGIDVEEMYERFEKLAEGGVISVEGKPINPTQMGEIEPTDLEKAMYTYLANFLMPLVMKDLTSV